MTADCANSRRSGWHLAASIAAVCVLLGTWARFCGLARWPLAIDEYYLEQSVLNVLRSGLPVYPCGGIYTRGLALQYVAAALQFGGVAAPLAPRLIAALSSLFALPAVYLLGRRLAGQTVAWIALAWIAISIWEVELSRLGRMYAPFQSVFLWYLVFFLYVAVDRKRWAVVPMLALSALGVLVWEGGFFLAVLNLLPPLILRPRGRPRVRDMAWWLGTALLCWVSFKVATLDLISTGAADYPPGYAGAPDLHLSRLDLAQPPWTTLSSHPLWCLIGLLPLLLTLRAAANVLRRPFSLLSRLGLLGVLALALAQQFQLAAALLLFLLLLGMLDRDELGRSVLPLWWALAGSFIFWSAFGLLTSAWHAPGLRLPRVVGLLLYEFCRTPDVFRVVIVPWARTVPVLGLALSVTLLASWVRAVRKPAATPLAERALLAVVLILLLGVGAGTVPRYETRYVYFLYPVLVIVVLVSLQRLLAAGAAFAGAALAGGAARLSRPALQGALLVLTSVGLFAMTEDCRPAHLVHIGSRAINLRLGMPGVLISHYQPRSDTRSAALWLEAHVDRPRDVVISSFPGIDFYYPHSDFYFMEESDPRFENWSCKAGTVARWSDRPLLYSVAELDRQIEPGRTVWIVLEAGRRRELLKRLPGVAARVEWTSATRDIEILSLKQPA